jgi:SOS-response transcriptional repressor LexA
MGDTVPVVSVVGERLRDLIPTDRGEQVSVAYRAGVTPEALNKILRGRTKEPGFETIAKIARALGVSLDLLYSDTELPAAPHRAVPDAISELDRRRISAFVGWASSRFALQATSEDDNVLEFSPHREAPKEMSADVVRTIADALGDVVEFRKGALWKEYEVPLVGTVSAGSGIEIFETYEKVCQIPEYYWHAGARAVFKVRGQSMLDMGITDNDLLFVKPTEKPKSGDVVICSLNGAAFVKEFERSRDGVRLISHNADYQPMEIGEQDDLRVFGGVVGRTGDLTGQRRSKRRE